MGKKSVFEQDMTERTKTQSKTENKTTGIAVTRKPRTMLSLSITEEDKRRIQTYCASQGITVASLVHQWITEYIPE